MSRGKSYAIEAVQAVVAVLGGVVGGVPLISYVNQKNHGALFDFLFGHLSGALAYAVPIAVSVAAIAVILLLERPRKQALVR